MKKFFLVIFVVVLFSGYAQFDRIFASEGDANKFISDYTRPVFKGLMYASNSAWITSAKPIKPFHIELNISASGAFVPPAYETFKFNDSDYNYLHIESGPDELPTVMGGESHTHLKIVIPDSAHNENKVLELDAPGGIKDSLPVNAVPAPAIQLSLGLPLGSEVNLRYLPELKDPSGGFINLIGIGVKHSITQYFPKPKDEKGNKKKRHFNIAIHAAYQHLSAGYNDPNSDKGVHLDLSTISFQGMASLDYKFISLYGAVGFSKGYTSLDVLGSYSFPYEVVDNNGNFIRVDNTTVIDPLKLSYDLNGMKAKAGIKLKLFFLQIYADYTLQEFPVATAGIGFKF